jgi:hypothetical protein
MEQKRICLTENELEEICLRFSELRGKDIYHSYKYLGSVFNLLARNQKVSKITKFSNFIDKKSDSFFMLTIVGVIFLLTKIAIENYFLSIK